MCMCTVCDMRVSVGLFFFFFQAEDGIRDLVRSRGLGDVYKRQIPNCWNMNDEHDCHARAGGLAG